MDSLLVTVTVAFGIAAPVASVTVPVRVPEISWATAMPVNARIVVSASLDNFASLRVSTVVSSLSQADARRRIGPERANRRVFRSHSGFEQTHQCAAGRRRSSKSTLSLIHSFVEIKLHVHDRIAAVPLKNKALPKQEHV